MTRQDLCADKVVIDWFIADKDKYKHIILTG